MGVDETGDPAMIAKQRKEPIIANAARNSVCPALFSWGMRYIGYVHVRMYDVRSVYLFIIV